MKIRNVSWAMAATLAMVTVVWQAKAGPDAGSPRGTIIVYRPWSLLSSGMEFNVNHGPDLLVRNGTYYRVNVLPGDSIISHDNMPFPIDEDEQTVHVEAGQTVYFECAIGLTLIFEEADDQERAARTVSRLQPLN